MPRPLLPIANRPLVEHVLTWLEDVGALSVGLCANSDTAALRHSLGEGESRRVDLHYYEDHMPRGPAGCVRDAAIDLADGPLVVVEGTILPEAVDLGRLLEAHARSEAAMTVVVDATGDPSLSAGDLSRPVGIYVLSAGTLDSVSASGYQDIKEALIPTLHHSGQRVLPYVADGSVPRVSDADSYLAANAWAVEQLIEGSEPPVGYRCFGDAIIHDSAEIDPTARFIGPVLVGPGCCLGRGVTVVGPTTIGTGCMINRGALVCRSLLWPGVMIEQDCVIDRCILTYNAGVKAAMTRDNRVCTTDWA